MDNKSYDKLLIMQDKIEAKNQDYNEKMKKLTVDLTGMIASMMDLNKFYEYSPDNKD